MTCLTCRHATCDTTEWVCRFTAPHTPCELRGWQCGAHETKTRPRYGDTDSHDHKCDECGQVFECGAGWHDEPDADGYMRPRRDCADVRTLCEDCTIAEENWKSDRAHDAHDEACHLADLAYHDGNC